MKRKTLFFPIAAALVSLSLFSCSFPDHNSDSDWPTHYPNAMVTVKQHVGGQIFLQLDDQTTLKPDNITTHPFDGKEVRAFTNYRELTGDGGEYDELVHVYWLDSILTKSTVPYPEEGSGQGADELYGNAQIDIVDDWITVVEDGYLTLHLRTEWYDANIKHRISLLTGGNPDNPYEVELRHDPNGDRVGKVADGYVAFRLSELPDTEGETVKLRLKWNSSRGERTVEFDYKTRVDPPNGQLAEER